MRERFPNKIKQMVHAMVPDEASRSKLVMKMVKSELGKRLNVQDDLIRAAI